MKIVWEWSLESETKRLLEMSLRVDNGFYNLHHFLPLPFSINKLRSNSSHHVYLPILPYSKIPRYWESVIKLGVDYPLRHLGKIEAELLAHLSKLKLPPLSDSQIKSEAEIYIPKTLSWLNATFPHLPLPEKILIHPSYFGTSGSFYFDHTASTITLYLRQDQSLYSLIEILLTALLRPHAGDTLYSDWEKTEYLVDYLLLESSLCSILPDKLDWNPTTIPPHFSQSLLKESALFLNQIGAHTQNHSHFSTHDNQVFFGNTPLTTLSIKESKVMKELIARSPNPVTLDKIADLIFTDDTKFSLAAIGKTIERLRSKLDSLGISSSYLATASGVGYYLKN